MRTDKHFQQRIFSQILRNLIESAKLAAGSRIIENKDKPYIDIVKQNCVYKFHFPNNGLLGLVSDEIKNPDFDNIFLVFNDEPTIKSRFIIKKSNTYIGSVAFKDVIEQNYFGSFVFISLWESKELNEVIVKTISEIYSEYNTNNQIDKNSFTYPQFIFINEHADN